MKNLVSLVLVAVVAACGSDGDHEAAALPTPAVQVQADARPRPKPTMGKVDCGQVAKHLTALSKRDIEATELAPGAKKNALVGATMLEVNITRTCERMWNDDTRRCLLAAANAAAVSACKKYQRGGSAPDTPPPPLPDRDPTCDAVITHLLNLATREIAASPAIPTPAKGTATAKAARLAIVLKPMCLRGWPGKLKRCVMKAQTAMDLEACRGYMPESLRRLEDRLTD